MWGAVNFGFGGYGVNGGKFALLTPEGEIEELEMPEGCAVVNNEAISFARFSFDEKTRMHMAGGFTDNLMLTENRHLVRPFIAPISEELVTSATPAEGQIGIEMIAGVGLIGSCIYFLRWRDSEHGRRSPFSGQSPTQVQTGVTIPMFRQVPLRPVPDDYCVDQVEVWVNRNGEKFNGRLVIRLLATRDSGAASFSVTEIAEGEAETADNLQDWPKCRGAVVFNQRLWMFGNEQDPIGLFGSILNRTDEYGGLRVVTRTGDIIKGSVDVRGVLGVFGPRSSYTLQGFTDADFRLDPLNGDLGTICHAGIQKFGEDALVPTHRGLYVFDGQAMRQVSGDYREFWIRAYTLNPTSFEEGFGIVDKKAGVYKFYPKPSSTPARPWIFDLSSLSPDEGGSFRAPMLSFDSYSDIPLCSANLSVPGLSGGDCYTGTTSGVVVKENVPMVDDNGRAFDVIIFPAMMGSPAANHEDGLKVEELFLFLSNHGLDPSDFDLRIVNGNEFAALIDSPLVLCGNTIGMHLQLPRTGDGKSFLIADDNQGQFQTPLGAGDTHFPMTLFFGNLSLHGEFFAPWIRVTTPKRLIFRGWGMNIQPGSAKLTLVEPD